MTLPTLTPAVKWQETDDKFCWRRKICTFLTHVLAQTLFCKHAFTNKHWALCLKHEYKQTDSLSPVSSDSVQASPGKIPIGACLTWLVKAYFTLCWPTSLRFLPSSAYTHPSFFYFPFFLPRRCIDSLPSDSSLNLQRRSAWAGKQRTGLFFFFPLRWLIAVQHLCSTHLDKHVALYETTRRTVQRGLITARDLTTQQSLF